MENVVFALFSDVTRGGQKGQVRSTKTSMTPCHGIFRTLHLAQIRVVSLLLNWTMKVQQGLFVIYNMLYVIYYMASVI